MPNAGKLNWIARNGARHDSKRDDRRASLSESLRISSTIECTRISWCQRHYTLYASNSVLANGVPRDMKWVLTLNPWSSSRRTHAALPR